MRLAKNLLKQDGLTENESLSLEHIAKVAERLDTMLHQVSKEVSDTVDVYNNENVKVSEELRTLEERVEALNSEIAYLAEEEECEIVNLKGFELLLDDDKKLRCASESTYEAKATTNEKLKDESERNINEIIYHPEDLFKKFDEQLISLNINASIESLDAIRKLLHKAISEEGQGNCLIKSSHLQKLQVEFLYRNTRLQKLLNQSFLTAFSIGFNCITVQNDVNLCGQTIKLVVILDALETLGTEQRVLRHLLQRLSHALLTHLVTSTNDLHFPFDCLKASVEITLNPDGVSWNWNVDNSGKTEEIFSSSNIDNEMLSKDNNSSSNSNCTTTNDIWTAEHIYHKAFNLAMTLESFGHFFCTHVFHAQSKLLRTFGTMWWRFTVNNIVEKQLKKKYYMPAIKLFTNLEQRLLSWEMLPPSEMPMEQLANRIRKDMLDHFSEHFLQIVRKLIFSEKIEIVATHTHNSIFPNPFTSISFASDFPSTESQNVNIASSKLAEVALKEVADSYLTLPRLGISLNLYTIIYHIYDLVEATSRSTCHNAMGSMRHNMNTIKPSIPIIWEFTLDDTSLTVDYVYGLIRKFVMLYVILFPTVHKEKLLSDQRWCACFYSNCSYVCYHLTVIPLLCCSSFSERASSPNIFLDLILLLRRLQETFYIHMIRAQQQRISSWFLESASDNRLLHVENKFHQSIEFINHLHDLWNTIFPYQVLSESICLLTDVILQHLNKSITNIKNLSSSEIDCLLRFITSCTSATCSLLETVSNSHPSLPLNKAQEKTKSLVINLERTMEIKTMLERSIKV